MTRARACSLVFDVRDPGGQPQANDPDGLVRDATFVSISTAIERISAVPWKRMSEPATAYLTGEAADGTVWLHSLGIGDQPDQCVAVIPSRRSA
jgi:hypothetical protein